VGAGDDAESPGVPHAKERNINKTGLTMIPGRRENLEPVCPFCGVGLARPTLLKINAGETVLGGTCSCGAIYLSDPTNKNVGEVMMQALSMAAEKISKDISEMASGVDYDDVVISYDARNHRSTGPSRGFADRSGRMYVLKLKEQ
jgi:hypothetical protein